MIISSSRNKSPDRLFFNTKTTVVCKSNQCALCSTSHRSDLPGRCDNAASCNFTFKGASLKVVFGGWGWWGGVVLIWHDLTSSFLLLPFLVCDVNYLLSQWGIGYINAQLPHSPVEDCCKVTLHHENNEFIHFRHIRNDTGFWAQGGYAETQASELIPHTDVQFHHISPHIHAFVLMALFHYKLPAPLCLVPCWRSFLPFFSTIKGRPSVCGDQSEAFPGVTGATTPKQLLTHRHLQLIKQLCVHESLKWNKRPDTKTVETVFTDR